MITLPDGAWCYSPDLPIAYTVAGAGPGAWVKDDISQWNLVWLSFPDGLERIRRGELQISKISTAINPEEFGIVTACARKEVVELFPGLRKALHSPLPVFMNIFANGFAIELPAAHLFGGRWAEIILENARRTAASIANGIEQAAAASHPNSPAMNTVHVATFGVRKSPSL